MDDTSKQCEKVLRRFIDAMNEWERTAAATKPNASTKPEIRDERRKKLTAELKSILGSFCTPTDSERDRETYLEFGVPPEYSNRVRITRSEIVSPGRVHLYVEDPEPHYAKEMRFILVHVDTQWRIEARELIHDGGRVEPWDL